MGSVYAKPRKGTRQLRLGRYSEKNRTYHIVTSTNGREPVFRSLQAGRLLVQALQRQEAARNSRTLAFMIMPDHLHWLMRLGKRSSLQAVVNAVKSESARNINRLHGDRGRLWQKGFYERAIRYDEDLPTVARYIIANPLRAGIVKSVSEYSLWDAVWVRGDSPSAMP